MKAIEKKLDNLWKTRVAEVYNYRCAMCGSQNGCSAHHIIKRGHKTTKWLLKNGIFLCEPHHTLAERDPKFVQGWLDKLYGTSFYEELKRVGNEFSHSPDYERIEDALRGERE